MSNSNNSISQRARTGRLGEAIAGLYLRLLGYRIIARNLRVQRGEIDLLVYKDAVYRLVEVRTTRSDHLPCPTLAVTPKKQRQLISLAQALSCRKAYNEHPICIDVIGIRIQPWRFPKIIWLKNAVHETNVGSCT